jgi:HAD superfamily hydrolase (TIGR01484 family)
MRYFALACDYDGTLAEHGHVTDATVAALERLRGSGRKLLLVSGRQLDDLSAIFPQIHLFDAVVAENGAVLYDAVTRDAQSLVNPPPEELVQELRRRGVDPLSTGRAIVATWEPHEQTVLQTIHDLNLELQVIFNKGAVMVLPTGINKASGLVRGLEQLKLSVRNAVGIGDAENDQTFLAMCECAVAVNNALDSVKSRVDWVTHGDHGAGVVELIDRLIDSDLKELSPVLKRRRVLIGHADDATDVYLESYDGNVLVAGPSGSGKTTVTTTLLERLMAEDVQCCVIDPEGDYDELPRAIALRSSDTRALADDVMNVLEHPAQSAVVNLMDLRLADQPLFLQRLLPRLLELRTTMGRPHWVVVDEAHHLLPASWQATEALLSALAHNTVLVTVHPDHVARAALNVVQTAIIVGREPQATADAFARGSGKTISRLPLHKEDANHIWLVREGASPLTFRPIQPTADRQRHRRKYAEGELGEDRSFYFRGPESRLNLRAQNLDLFKQIADGVDDATWEFHLRRHDISGWFRDVIKDDALAKEAAAIEDAHDLSPADSRVRIRKAIERRYTAPA